MPMAIFVCDSAVKAAAAALVLESNGYAANHITTEQPTALLYNGQQFSNGGLDQFMTPQWVVTGRN